MKSNLGVFTAHKEEPRQFARCFQTLLILTTKSCVSERFHKNKRNKKNPNNLVALTTHLTQHMNTCAGHQELTSGETVHSSFDLHEGLAGRENKKNGLQLVHSATAQTVLSVHFVQRY